MWQWLGPMIHAKTVVVDGRWSVIGSSNLDPLSLRRNLEFDVEIHGSAMGEQLRATFARDGTNCRPYTSADWVSRPAPRRAMSRLAYLCRGIL